MIVEKAEVQGSGKGPNGWFTLRQANVSFDHPFHAPLEHALNIDFVNEAEGLGTRVAVELSPESARKLMEAIQAALARGEESGHIVATESAARR
jgi:hypothetical protein